MGELPTGGSGMRAITTLLRFLAFLFNLALCLGLFFLALLVMPSGKHNIQLAVVPLTGSKLTYSVLVGSIYGFVAMVLALRRTQYTQVSDGAPKRQVGRRAARFPMLVWNLAVTGLLVAAPFRSQFSFEGKDHFVAGIYFFLASLAALWGSWLHWKKAGGL